jgi:hypothetical protein
MDGIMTRWTNEMNAADDIYKNKKMRMCVYCGLIFKQRRMSAFSIDDVLMHNSVMFDDVNELAALLIELTSRGLFEQIDKAGITKWRLSSFGMRVAPFLGAHEMANVS